MAVKTVHNQHDFFSREFTFSDLLSSVKTLSGDTAWRCGGNEAEPTLGDFLEFLNTAWSEAKDDRHLTIDDISQVFETVGPAIQGYIAMYPLAAASGYPMWSSDAETANVGNDIEADIVKVEKLIQWLGSDFPLANL